MEKMRAETRKRGTNIHSFSMNNACLCCFHKDSPRLAPVSLIFILKKKKIRVYDFPLAALL